MKPNLLISFSGGETSAFMTQWLLANKRNEFDMTVAFANTGEENEATLEFVEKCDKHFGLNVIWLECITNPIWGKGVKAKKVTFETANRDGAPFEAMIAKHGIPNVNMPFCSRELKSYTINSYVRENGLEGYTAIGYRSDEIDRVNENWRKKKHVYPLIMKDMKPMSKPLVNAYWRDMPFRITLKGYEDNCKVCWKKALRKLLTIAKYHPERFNNFAKWEKKYEYYVPESRKNSPNQNPPYRFYRDNLTVEEILAMSKEPFEEAKDDRLNFVEYKQTEMWGHPLDISFGCTESCEVF